MRDSLRRTSIVNVVAVMGIFLAQPSQAAQQQAEQYLQSILSTMNTWAVLLGALVTMLVAGSFVNMAGEYRRSQQMAAKMREHDQRMENGMSEFQSRYHMPADILREARNEARNDFDPRLEALTRSLDSRFKDLAERVGRVETEAKGAIERLYMLLMEKAANPGGKGMASEQEPGQGPSKSVS